MSRPATPAPLIDLARLHGVEPVFIDNEKRARHASPEALLSILRSLGVALDRAEEAPQVLREERRRRARRWVEPVAVAWDGVLPEVTVRIPGAVANGFLRWKFHGEGGDERAGEFEIDPGQVREHRVEGERVKTWTFQPGAAGPLPSGRYDLVLEIGDTARVVHVIAAPRCAFTPADARPWGVFAPTYALRSRRTIGGCGDLGDLEALAHWAGTQGASVVGTLPLLATFLDEPFEPSPYAPVSRRFWNELFLNLESLPELAHAPDVRDRLASPGFRDAADRLWQNPLVAYRDQQALRRPLLEQLARIFFERGGEESTSFRSFARRSPRVRDYAAFRAGVANTPRGEWSPGEHRRWEYHLYVQFRFQEQIEELCARIHESGVTLYLDLPLGVHPEGFDAASEKEQFLDGCTVGSPPDPFFNLGQNWGFAPLNPEVIRQRGYDYVGECFDHGLRVAGTLRIDHVMSLHRLYCIPRGMNATDGVYVRYPAEELYALLSVASHRHRCMLAGEDLGTVPEEVRIAMKRHDIRQLFVVQYEIEPDAAEPLRAVPKNSVASLNTHDMPPFNAFWEGEDLLWASQYGFSDPAEPGRREAEREALRRALLRRYGIDDPQEVSPVLEKLLRVLGESPASLVLVNLEDLWLETHAQNVPGTTSEHPNWRRKLRFTLEEIESESTVRRFLESLDASRKRPHTR